MLRPEPPTSTGVLILAHALIWALVNNTAVPVITGEATFFAKRLPWIVGWLLEVAADNEIVIMPVRGWQGRLASVRHGPGVRLMAAGSINGTF